MKRHKVHRSQAGTMAASEAPGDSKGNHNPPPRATSRRGAGRPGGRAHGTTARALPAAKLTPAVTRVLYAAAVLGDVAQVAMGPFKELTHAGQGVGLVVGLVALPLLRFHPLLFVTLLFEFVPNANMLPMWTASVAVLMALRKGK